jgi:class 3 adenylate cyclase/pimeloyl-ACP methyl ester carboxylesterase
VQIPPTTSYARHDGVSIAFQSFGSGPPLVMVPVTPSHLDLMWIDPGYTQVLRRLAGFARTVVFDPRGLGLSDPVDHVPTLEEAADDIESVMDAAGVERAVLFAAGNGCPGTAMFAARAPGRVDGLVLLNPYAQGTKAGPDPSTIVGWDERMARSLADWEDAVEHHWGEGRTLKLFAREMVTDRLLRSWGMLERASASPAMIRAVTQAALEADVRDVLANVRAPAIVVGREGGFQPRAIVEHVAELLPDAEFEWLAPTRQGDGLEGFLGPVIDLVERLVTGGRATQSAERVLATVLFTDIVGSTELASAMGDDRWRILLDRHEQLLRDHVESAGGRLVKMIGDGSLSVFDGPARAIRCAHGFRGAVRALDVEVRAGLHTGECELVGDDLAGLAVHIGARVSGKAGAGEILVSRTVKELVAGSGLHFRDLGSHELKGVPGTWELFALGDGSAQPVTVAPEEAPTQAVDRLVLAAARRAPRLLRFAGRLSRD